MKHFILVLAVFISACGPKQYRIAVTADVALSQAIFSLDDAERAAFKAGVITPEKHKTYGVTILALLKAGDDLTLALKAWDPAKPAPGNIAVALGQVQGLLSDLKIESPAVKQVIFAAETVLSVLRGSGVLPMEELDASVTVEVNTVHAVVIDRFDQGKPAVRTGAVLPVFDECVIARRDTSERDRSSFDVGMQLRLRKEPRSEGRREQSEETATAEHALILHLEAA